MQAAEEAQQEPYDLPHTNKALRQVFSEEYQEHPQPSENLRHMFIQQLEHQPKPPHHHIMKPATVQSALISHRKKPAMPDKIFPVVELMLRTAPFMQSATAWQASGAIRRKMPRPIRNNTTSVTSRLVRLSRTNFLLRFTLSQRRSARSSARTSVYIWSQTCCGMSALQQGKFSTQSGWRCNRGCIRSAQLWWCQAPWNISEMTIGNCIGWKCTSSSSGNVRT